MTITNPEIVIADRSWVKYHSSCCALVDATTGALVSDSGSRAETRVRCSGQTLSLEQLRVELCAPHGQQFAAKTSEKAHPQLLLPKIGKAWVRLRAAGHGLQAPDAGIPS